MAEFPDFRARLAELAARDRLRELRIVEGDAVRVTVDGRPALSFCSNDYLGLADSRDLAMACASSALEAGVGAGASRLVTGNRTGHAALEKRLAEFHQVEELLLFNSGYNANIGILPAIAGAGALIVSDELNHASIIDGCRLSRARTEVFAHADPEALEQTLRSKRHLYSDCWVVTESAFSMDGDCAPLADYARLCRRYDAGLYVDEAHTIGVLGPGGRGLCAALGINPDVIVATLGKAFGCFGAYAFGRDGLAPFLANCARSFVFTTGLPQPLVAAASAAVELVASEEGARRRQTLQERLHQLRTGLGLPTDRPQANRIHSAITPLVVGADSAVMNLTEQLLQRGVFVQGIRPPTVPEGTARLRITLTASHSSEDVEQLLGALNAVLGGQRSLRSAESPQSYPQAPGDC